MPPFPPMAEEVARRGVVGGGGGGGGAWGSRKREQGRLSFRQHLKQRGLAIGQGGQGDGSGQKIGGAGLWGLCRRSYEPGAL